MLFSNAVSNAIFNMCSFPTLFFNAVF
jgi:hypothetical protein